MSKSKPYAVRLTNRGLYFVQELFKLRRMTFPQIAMLFDLDPSKRNAEWIVRRLEALDLVAREKAPNHRRKLEGDPEMVECARLTEKGLRLAAESLGRLTKENPRDAIKYYQHLLMGVDLYLEIVQAGGQDWVQVRNRAQRFQWFSSNEGTRIDYERMREFQASREKRSAVTPDVMIETDTHRYLVEIERSTKSHKVVRAKIDQYADLFSPLKTAAGKPAYELKYMDDKKPVVVFVFQSDERADAALAYYKRRCADPSFRLSDYRCGSVTSVAAMFRGELLRERSERATPVTALSELEASAVKRMFGEVRHVFEDLQRAYDVIVPSLPPEQRQKVRRPHMPTSFELVGRLVERLNAISKAAS